MTSQMIEALERHDVASRPAASARIVLIVPQFPQLSETFIVSKFLGLLATGHDVHVVCAGSEAAEWRRFPELRAVELRRRVHVTASTQRVMVALLYPYVLLRCLVSAPAATARYLRSGWREFGLDVLRRFYIDAELIRLRPDIVHFEFGALAVGRMYLKRLLSCKIVVSFRGYDINFVGLERDDHYQEVWENADALHFLGCHLWNRARARGCPDTVRRFLIPPAVDATVFANATAERTASDGDALRIVSVGRLRWEKGYEYALKAVALLRQSGVSCEYRIVGDGPAMEAIAFARHQLGLENTVHLLGSLPPAEVRDHLQWAQVYLHAAVSEGFCNAVLEAQAAGLPVVCTDAGGLPENVLDGVTGFVVPRRSSQPVAARLAELAGDRELRSTMGQAARRRALDEFNSKRQMSAFLAMYQEVLAQSDAPRTTYGTEVVGPNAYDATDQLSEVVD